MRLKYQWLKAEPKGANRDLDHQPRSGQTGLQPSVLIVDDDRLIRVMLHSGLPQYGFNILLAQDGWEAIEVFKLHQQDIAIVLLDVCMPGLDGLHTMNGLRAIDPQVQICFMSGDTGHFNPDFLRRRGANGFIAKPFMMDRLAETLLQMANGGDGETASSTPCFNEDTNAGVARPTDTAILQTTSTPPVDNVNADMPCKPERGNTYA